MAAVLRSPTAMWSPSTRRTCIPQEASRAIFLSLQSRQFSSSASLSAREEPLRKLLAPIVTRYTRRLAPYYRTLSRTLSPHLAPLYRRTQPWRRYWRNWYTYNRDKLVKRGYSEQWFVVGITVCAAFAVSWVWSVVFVLVMYGKQVVWGEPERNFRDRPTDEVTRDLIDRKYLREV